MYISTAAYSLHGLVVVSACVRHCTPYQQVLSLTPTCISTHASGWALPKLLVSGESWAGVSAVRSVCRAKSGSDWQAIAAEKDAEAVRLRAEINRMRLALSSTNQVGGGWRGHRRVAVTPVSGGTCHVELDSSTAPAYHCTI